MHAGICVATYQAAYHYGEGEDEPRGILRWISNKKRGLLKSMMWGDVQGLFPLLTKGFLILRHSLHRDATSITLHNVNFFVGNSSYKVRHWGP